MAIGVVNEKDFEQELSKGEKTISIAEIKNKTPLGRGEGNKEVPESLRKVIAETSEINGRQEGLTLARQFGISDSSVSAYSNGAHSTTTYDKPNEGLKKFINQRKERISKKANRVLISSLNELTSEKLKDVKAIELSTIARNMASIVKDMEPEPDKPGSINNNGPTFIMFAPPFVKEDKFDVVNLNE